jgi:hypothetical protein
MQGRSSTSMTTGHPQDLQGFETKRSAPVSGCYETSFIRYARIQARYLLSNERRAPGIWNVGANYLVVIEGNVNFSAPGTMLLVAAEAPDDDLYTDSKAGSATCVDRSGASIRPLASVLIQCGLSRSPRLRCTSHSGVGRPQCRQNRPAVRMDPDIMNPAPKCLWI